MRHKKGREFRNAERNPSAIFRDWRAKAFVLLACVTVFSFWLVGRLEPVLDAEIRREGRVVGVMEGDIITVLWADTGYLGELRLWGIDAPEQDQPGGDLATNAMKGLLNSQVSVRVTGEDQYGRVVGEVFRGEQSVNATLVGQGLAWHYVREYPDASDLAALQQKAMTAKYGLWSAASAPTSPWEWRWQAELKSLKSLGTKTDGN